MNDTEIIIKLVKKINNSESLERILNLVIYLYLKE